MTFVTLYCINSHTIDISICNFMCFHFYFPAMNSHLPIDSLKANEGAKFSKEYETIEPGQQFTWDNSNLETNKPRNGYANVTDYEHSRDTPLSVD